MAGRKPIGTDLAKIEMVDPGDPFVMLPLSLLSSAAWRGMSVNCRRLIDFLLVEHLQHGGAENGQLAAPYDQLEQSGLSRRLINATIKEAEQRGLLVVERGGKKPYVRNAMSRYRLTFLPSIKFNELGHRYRVKRTDDWKRHGQFEPKNLQRKNGFQVPEGEPSQVPESELNDRKSEVADDRHG